mgnify:CR=1 FL=1
MIAFAERLGRRTVDGVAEMGRAAVLFGESCFWIFAGGFRKQPVRIPSVFAQGMEIGIRAIPIVTVLSLTIGVMLGRVLGTVVGKRAEIVGGIVLIMVGSTILYEHLSAV